MDLTNIINCAITHISDKKEAANDTTATIKVSSLTAKQAKSVGMDLVADENCVVTVPVSIAESFKKTPSQTSDGPAICR